MSLASYNPGIEERIRNFVRTEEPVTVNQIARRIKDLPLYDLDQLLWEMVRDGMLHRVWNDDSFADIKFRL